MIFICKCCVWALNITERQLRCFVKRIFRQIWMSSAPELHAQCECAHLWGWTHSQDTPPCPWHSIPELAQLSEPHESVICSSGRQNCQQGKGKWAPALCHSAPSSYTAWLHGQRLQGCVCVQWGIPTIPDYTSYGPKTDSTEILSAGETGRKALNLPQVHIFSEENNNELLSEETSPVCTW